MKFLRQNDSDSESNMRQSLTNGLFTHPISGHYFCIKRVKFYFWFCKHSNLMQECKIRVNRPYRQAYIGEVFKAK